MKEYRVSKRGSAPVIGSILLPETIKWYKDENANGTSNYTAFITNPFPDSQIGQWISAIEGCAEILNFGPEVTRFRKHIMLHIHAVKFEDEELWVTDDPKIIPNLSIMSFYSNKKLWMIIKPQRMAHGGDMECLLYIRYNKDNSTSVGIERRVFDIRKFLGEQTQCKDWSEGGDFVDRYIKALTDIVMTGTTGIDIDLAYNLLVENKIAEAAKAFKGDMFEFDVNNFERMIED